MNIENSSEEKSGKKGPLIFLALLLVCLIGGFAAGRVLLSSFFEPAPEHEEHAQATPATAADIDLGIFSVSFPGTADSISISVTASVPADKIPEMVVMRDGLQGMLASIAEMPVIAAEGLTSGEITYALIVLRDQELPWAETFEVDVIQG